MSYKEKLYKVRELAEMLNLSPVTIRKWIYETKVKAIKIGKEWRIPESEVKRILTQFGIAKEEPIRAVIYARVSSRKQKENLQRQIERLRMYASARGYKIVDIISDIASGLNESRKGLSKLFDYVERRLCDVIIVEFKDRLTRFGFEYLKRYFSSYGVRIEVVEETERKSYLEELLEDFVAIVTSFCARIYGKRSQKFQKIKKFIEDVVYGGN